MTAHWPQFAAIALYLAGLVGGAITSGARGNWGPLIGQVVACSVGVFILYEGGFWVPLGWSP